MTPRSVCSRRTRADMRILMDKLRKQAEHIRRSGLRLPTGEGEGGEGIGHDLEGGGYQERQRRHAGVGSVVHLASEMEEVYGSTTPTGRRGWQEVVNSFHPAIWACCSTMRFPVEFSVLSQRPN